MNVAGLRAALRIARRDAVRAKGRSALVVAMIGLPMLGLAFVDVAVRTAQLPREEVARRELGAADLVAELVSAGPVQQRGPYDYSSKESMGRNGGRPPEKAPDVAAALPPGSRVTERSSHYAARLRGNGERIAMGEVTRLDLNDEMADGLVRLREGTFPRDAGEAAVTTRLADEVDLDVGDTLTLEPSGTTFRVSALVVLPSSLTTSAAFLPASATIPRAVGDGDVVGRRWAVTLPPGVRDLDVMPALNRIGLRVSPRSWILDPPPDPYVTRVDAEAVGVGVVVVGLATLEIVLLAGTAFAVGARRRQRELALVAATGGDRKDVRRVVLAGGVVLGAVGGGIGVIGGIAAVPLARPVLDRLNGELLGPLDVRPLEIAAIVLVGTVTALLAAVLPARSAARQPVVAALTGRRTEARARTRVPYVALAAIVAGAALAFWAAGDGKVPAARSEDGNGLVPVSGRPANFTLVLVGAVVAELGFVACAPALVGLVGRLSRRLPLSLRLAARDAARHRTRSGPAVAAVVAAVAGSVALSVYVASDTERQRRDYTPWMASGSVWIGRSDPSDPAPERDVTAAVAALPVRERMEVYDVASPCAEGFLCTIWQLEAPPDHRCDAEGGVECFRNAPRPGPVLAGEPAYAEWVVDREDAAVEAALRDGKVVVFDERWIQDGQVVLRGETRSRVGTVVRSRTVRLPAVATTAPEYGSTPAAVMTRATAHAVRLPTLHTATVLTTTRMPTNADIAAARGALTRTSYASLDVERGFERDPGMILLALVLGSSVVTVGATGVATGLAAADSRPDLATLAAVGAAPGVRRRLAMAQAATVALLGSALGILAGLVPAVAIVGARAEVPLAMPWGALTTTAVGVPLLAALLMGAVTRSRLPLARRIA